MVDGLPSRNMEPHTLHTDDGCRVLQCNQLDHTLRPNLTEEFDSDQLTSVFVSIIKNSVAGDACKTAGHDYPCPPGSGNGRAVEAS